MKQVVIVLSKKCRIITRCLKPAPVDKTNYLPGIAFSDKQKEVAANDEKLKVPTSNVQCLTTILPLPDKI